MQAKSAEQKKEDADAADENKFDEFMGNDAGAFAATGEYDQDDREADAVWDQIDEYMDQRRRDRREKILKEELEKYRAANPKIVEGLAPFKRKLAEITDEEWEAIPEIGDYTIKKTKRFESFAPVPDTLLAKAAAEKAGHSCKWTARVPRPAAPPGCAGHAELCMQVVQVAQAAAAGPKSNNDPLLAVRACPSLAFAGPLISSPSGSKQTTCGACRFRPWYKTSRPQAMGPSLSWSILVRQWLNIGLEPCA